jgi:hypothetical protein
MDTYGCILIDFNQYVSVDTCIDISSSTISIYLERYTSIYIERCISIYLERYISRYISIYLEIHIDISRTAHRYIDRSISIYHDHIYRCIPVSRCVSVPPSNFALDESFVRRWSRLCYKFLSHGINHLCKKVEEFVLHRASSLLSTLILWSPNWRKQYLLLLPMLQEGHYFSLQRSTG